MTRTVRPALADAWAEFVLAERWHWFATLTFGGNPHPETADKSWRVWVSKLNRFLAGPRWYKRPTSCVRWLRGEERQQRGTVHYHALLGHPWLASDSKVPVSRQAWQRAWWDLGSFAQDDARVGPGVARIYAVESERAVAIYCAKYAMKEGVLEFGGPWRASVDQLGGKVAS